MASRGFFAEMQHQAKLAEREHARNVREAERARKARERAAAQEARAAATDQKRLAKEAQEAHVSEMEDEAESKNTELARIYQEIDGLLAATLDVDDFVDLNSLRIVPQHPEFDRKDLENPLPPPGPIVDPTEPQFFPPVPPRGLQALLLKKRHEKQVSEAIAAHETAVAKWKADLSACEKAREAAAANYKKAEADRIAQLAVEKARYASECAAREEQAAEHNRSIDSLIANLGYGVAEAVQEYIAIVMSNSVYPEQFPVEHRFDFDPGTAELKLRVLIPGPDLIPAIGGYKYKKADDEIIASQLPQKACRDRYASAVHQVALRSFHEVFEADRRGIIKTVSLEVGTETILPATGLPDYIPFVAAGAERDSFMKLDLSNVVPSATLGHLGAAVSKNPWDLIRADVSGIRRS